MKAFKRPTACAAEVFPAARDPWATGGWEVRRWRTAVARLSDRVEIRPISTGDVAAPDPEAFRVSRPGTLTAAIVLVDGLEVFIAVSGYSVWEYELRPREAKPYGADASAHRLLSDVTPLVRCQPLPVVFIADLNILYGYGEGGDPIWARRYAGVFQHAEDLGLAFAGPQYPNGVQAHPRPEELPLDSLNVPTFRYRPEDLTCAKRQLDFAFVSADLRDRVRVTALNGPDVWGPSDHCRVVVDVFV